jgi:hypothetical protein
LSRNNVCGESEDSNVDVPFGVIERATTELLERMDSGFIEVVFCQYGEFEWVLS